MELPEIVQNEDDAGVGDFTYPNPDGDEPLGEIAYYMQGSTMVVTHTGIREALRGQGAAKKLVYHLIDHARNQSLRVQPNCPFTRKVMDGDPSTQDVRR